MTAAERHNGITKYSLHYQARKAYIPDAAWAEMSVWRKEKRSWKKRHKQHKQTDPARPKTKYYAHMQPKMVRGSYFHYVAAIFWEPRSIYLYSYYYFGQWYDVYASADVSTRGCFAE